MVVTVVVPHDHPTTALLAPPIPHLYKRVIGLAADPVPHPLWCVGRSPEGPSPVHVPSLTPAPKLLGGIEEAVLADLGRKNILLSTPRGLQVGMHVKEDHEPCPLRHCAYHGHQQPLSLPRLVQRGKVSPHTILAVLLLQPHLKLKREDIGSPHLHFLQPKRVILPHQ